MAPSSVVVPMENPKGISLLAVNDLNSSTFGDKNKAANPKRFTKAFLLKAQRRLGCIPWMANRLPCCFWIKFRKINPIINKDACDLEDGSYFPMLVSRHFPWLFGLGG
ncbi:hypothetical protein T459_14727 [Capsicum annuum]|uniref:Uncharacterized protein n=1 Tax=Capsicum annuum TaxID=4072 RepID=A0A2G2ZI97_CAPAN|nr:hypothetical protein FXO37_12430 [Capsicum annuum]PHT81712.1 hypothetical protein T459_14727 [Capsicum annuum]